MSRSSLTAWHTRISSHGSVNKVVTAAQPAITMLEMSEDVIRNVS